MGKRIKKVFSQSSQVYHLWANQSQDKANTSKFRAFFKGASAYSYGTHYEVGRIVKYNGVQVGIVNNSGYSSTTDKHINEAYGALDGLMPRIKASTFNVRDALLEIQGEYIDSLMGLLNRRVFWEGCNMPSAYETGGLEEFNAACRTLKHPELVLEIPEDLKALIMSHVKFCLKRATELDATKKERRTVKLAAELRKNQADVRKWRLGLIPATNFISTLKPQILRLAPRDGKAMVQSSAGAEVPLIEAQNLLRQIEVGTAKQGDTVGSFSLQSVSMDVVKIGCHVIELDEARAVLLSKPSRRGLLLVRGGK